jgi:ubiquinone/menaquinone biosynthesis C-methylase UbiE
MLIKFIKFCIVGGTGAIITFGLTWLLTEELDLWYMGSLVIATIVAMTSNFLFNNYWTFSTKLRNPSDADYEWFAFYHGNPVQKWWKQSIAKIVWNWIPNSSKLLDIGCGSSPVIGHYSNAIGLEKNEDKVMFMRKRFPKNSFINMDTTQNLHSNSFDYVLCIEVVEHSKEPEDIIKEISRLLKVYGTCVIATPDYSKILWHIAEKFTPYKDEHITKFTRESLEEMCKKYKLVPNRFRYVAKCDLVEQFTRIE